MGHGPWVRGRAAAPRRLRAETRRRRPWESHPTSTGLHPRLGHLNTVSPKRVPLDILDKQNSKKRIY